MKWMTKAQYGVDLGHRTIKGLKLVKRSGKVHLDTFFYHDLAEGNDTFPAVKNLGETLKGICEVKGFSGKAVASSIDDSEVETFDLILPTMPENDLRSAVMNEVESRISYPVEEASVDYVRLSTSKDDNQENVALKAYCLKVERIKSHLALLKSASLTASSMETSMLANIAMLEFNSYLDDDGSTVIVDLGETKANIGLLLGRKLAMMHSVSTSLGTINGNLMRKLGISYLEAEAIKVKSSSRSDDDGSPEVLQIVDETYLELFHQLQKAIEYFRATARVQKLARIFLIGGGSQYQPVASLIERTCRAETVVVNPFRNIEIFAKDKPENEKIADLSPYMSTAVGLALRGLDGR